MIILPVTRCAQTGRGRTFTPDGGFTLDDGVYAHRKSVTISRASGAVTDYKMIAYIGESERFSPYNMTTNTLPVPFVVSASTELTGTNDAFRAFDGTTGSWIANATTGWLKLYSGGSRPRKLTSYTIVGANTGTTGKRSPKAWTVQGSNDNSNWTTVDTVTNETGWGESESRTYVCDSPSSTAFNYYKIDLTENNGDAGYVSIRDFYLNGPDFSCAGKGKTDFSDLRFTTSDGSTVLDYFIRSLSGSTPNQIAEMWIEFDYIGTDATTFHMYYGNDDASAYSNMENTGVFSDNFSSDDGVWTDETIADGVLKVGYGVSTSSTHSLSVVSPGAMYCEFLYTWGTAANWAQAGTMSFGNNYILLHLQQQLIKLNGGATTIAILQDRVPHKIRIYWWGGSANQFTMCYDAGASSTSVTTTLTTVGANVDTINFALAGTMGPSRIDDLFITRYVNPEPVWGAWGEEEAT